MLFIYIFSPNQFIKVGLSDFFSKNPLFDFLSGKCFFSLIWVFNVKEFAFSEFLDTFCGSAKS